MDVRRGAEAEADAEAEAEAEAECGVTKYDNGIYLLVVASITAAS